MTLRETVAALPSHTEKAKRWSSLDVPLARLDEAQDCGFAVQRGGWWNRTVKGDEYLATEPA